MKTLTVTAVNSYIKAVLGTDSNLTDISVEGELSNFKQHSSGHCYFTLKDSGGVLKCVMFRSSAQRLKFMPENGMKVEVRGSISVYERDGVYQLYAESMKQGGIGNLYEIFERTKKKLEAEGLFDRAYKKAIPFLPSVVGVITSPTGAVFSDIKNVIYRRFPTMRLRLFPAAVQGEEAVPSIVRNLAFINEHRLCDVIILARGGGSIEDLWAFNEEAVARAVFASGLPVISAVGHETDYTVADFAADLRAPTPSAAAELAVPVLADVRSSLELLKGRLAGVPRRSLDIKRKELLRVKENVFFKRPGEIVRNKRQYWDELSEKLAGAMKERMKSARHRLQVLETGFNALSPYKVLERGYSLVRDQEGRIVTDGSCLKSGEIFEVTGVGGSFEGRKI